MHSAQIRGEFMRAVRVLSTRTDRIDSMIRELCEERQDGVLMAPPSNTSRRKSAPQYREREPSPIPPLPLTASQGAGGLRAWPAAPNGVSMPASAPPAAPGYPPSLYPPRRHSPRRQSSLEPVGAPIPEDDAFPQHFPQPPSPDPGYPQLTTSRMQDHSIRQGGVAVDARPRYPPESVASEPAPLDRDLEWNRDSGVGMPSSSSTSSSGGLAATAVGGYQRFFGDQHHSRAPTQTATAPASPQRTAADGQRRSSSQQSGIARRRTTDPSQHPMSSFLINGRNMPDFSRFPMGPIRFGNFGPDGMGMVDAATEAGTTSSDKQAKSLGLNGVPGSPTTPRATTARTPNTVAEIGIPPRTPGSPAQLSRKIVFGDVEVSTEASREAREKALAALLRKRRPTTASSQGHQSSTSSGGSTSKADVGSSGLGLPQTPPPPGANGTSALPRHARGHEPGSPTTPVASQYEFGTAVQRASVVGEPSAARRATLSNGSLSGSPGSSTGASGAPSAPTSPTASFPSLTSPVPTGASSDPDGVAKAMAGLMTGQQ